MSGPGGPGRGRLGLTLAATAFLALAALVGARTLRNLNVPGQPHLERYGLQDFRDNFYYPVVAALDGRNPWDPDDYRARYPVARELPPYSPLLLLFHLPFGILPYGAAEAAFFAATLGLLVALAAIAIAGAGRPPTAAGMLALAALLLASRPGHMTLFIGQCSALMAVGAALALVCARTRPGWAAFGVVIVCVKPSYALPLVALLLLRRDHRPVVLGLAWASLLGAAAAIGPVRAAGGIGPFVAAVRHGVVEMNADPSYAEASSVIRLDLASLVGRLLGRSPSAAAEIALGLAVVGAAGLAVRRLSALERDPRRPLTSGLIAIAVLLSSYHQAYDALLLALPATAAALGAAPAPGPGAGRRWRAAFVSLSAVPAANYLATNTLVNRLAPSPRLWLLITCANGAAILAAFLLWLAPAFRRGPRGSPG